MPRLALLLPTLLAGCLVLPEPHREPLERDPACDVDRDGVPGPDCGGPDCDDLDPTIRPGAAEVFGDDLDQDCDGSLDAHRDQLDAPARTVFLDGSWSRDLRQLGGPVQTSTGRLLGWELTLAPTFGGGVEVKTRTDYGEAPEDLAAIRILDEAGALDLVHADGTLSAYRPDPPTARAAWTTELLTEGPLDAAADPDGLWVVTCDGATVEVIRRHPDGAVDGWTLERPAHTCALLGGPGDPQVLLIGEALPLERWVLDPDTGFGDRLTLAERADLTEVRTDSGPVGAALALFDEGEILVFDRGGEGAILGDGAATDRFDVAVDETGEVLVSWLDEAGTLWAAVGPLPGPIEAVALADDLDADAIYARLTADELAIAVLGGPRLSLFRALR
jgi:hypothetical protein